MSAERMGRGRPKGSGMDDRAQLEAIAQLLQGDANLKPTTAIKQLGITDPSDIRRLRDKFRQLAARDGALPSADDRAVADGAPEASVAVVAASSDLKSNSGQVGLGDEPESSVECAAIVADASQGSPDAPVLSEYTVLRPDVASPPVGESAYELFTKFFALGISFASTAAQVQLAVAQSMLKDPHVAALVKHQVVLNEVTKRLFDPDADGPSENGS